MATETDPEILSGKPVIKGTRIPVDLILELAGLGYLVDQIIGVPYLKRAAILDKMGQMNRVVSLLE